MSMVYSGGVPASEKDWVRLIILDTTNVTATEKLTDEEIVGLIALQSAAGVATKAVAIRYYAAAACKEAIHSKQLLAGNGQQERETPELRVKWGGLDNKEESRLKEISRLRRLGADAEMGSSKRIRAM